MFAVGDGMGASDFEFKYRFWIFGAIFFFAFGSYNLDHINAGQAFVDWIARSRGVPASDAQYHVIFAIGALLCIANAAIRTWATAYLNPEVMTDKRLHTSRLVADGPYRYVRNPLYFGNVLLGIGFGLMASRLGFFILALGMLVYVYRLILREEAAIRASQGESYRAYCSAVPRLVPALRPRLPGSGAKPNWRGGLLGEAFMWLLAASVVAFAVTFSLTIFFVVLASAYVVVAVSYVLIRRARAKTAGVPDSDTERPPGQAGHSTPSS